MLKFLIGDGPNVRRPGDVGLAKSRILLPNWKHLRDTQGIKADRSGNLPSGVAARFKREAGGRVAKRRVPGRWGVYEGEIELESSHVMGYIARPPRVKAPVGKGGRLIWVNQGRPRLLLVAVQQATYQPVLQRPFQNAVDEAGNNLPEQMAAEHQDAVDYQARRAAGR